MAKFTRLANPAKKRKTSRRRPRRIPNGGGVLTIMSNPRRKRSHRRSTRRRKGAVARMSNPRRHRRNPRHSFRRRRNPAVLGMGLTELIKLGAGAAAGGFGARAIPQAILGASNAGWMGYVANLVSTFGLGWIAGKFAGRDAQLGVLAGGLSATGMRIWGDYMAPTAPVAQAASVSGMGDYQFSSTGLGWYSPFDNGQGRGGWYKAPSAIASAAPAATGGGKTVTFPARARQW